MAGTETSTGSSAVLTTGSRWAYVDTTVDYANWVAGVGAPKTNKKACWAFIRGAVDSLYVHPIAGTDSVEAWGLYNYPDHE